MFRRGLIKELREHDAFCKCMSFPKLDRNSRLEDSYPHVKHLLSEKKGRDCQSLFIQDQVKSRVSIVMDENVLTGRHNGGNITLTAYNHLVPDAGQKELEKVHFCAWIMEVCQGFLTITDDIMDKSETRRGKACWYKRSDIGVTATNDVLSLMTSVYELLLELNLEPQQFQRLVRLLTNSLRMTITGEYHDLLLSDSRKNMNLFTEPMYKQLVMAKTAQYSFVCPFVAALELANETEMNLILDSTQIMQEMGLFVQVQNDFIDTFVSEEQSGKKGSDIARGTCNWFIVQALKSASPEEEKILQQNYGQRDEEAIDRVKQVYDNKGLYYCFLDFEKRQKRVLDDLILTFDTRHPVIGGGVFRDILSRVSRPRGLTEEK